MSPGRLLGWGWGPEAVLSPGHASVQLPTVASIPTRSFIILLEMLTMLAATVEG